MAKLGQRVYVSNIFSEVSSTDKHVKITKCIKKLVALLLTVFGISTVATRPSLFTLWRYLTPSGNTLFWTVTSMASSIKSFSYTVNFLVKFPSMIFISSYTTLESPIISFVKSCNAC